MGSSVALYPPPSNPHPRPRGRRAGVVGRWSASVLAGWFVVVVVVVLLGGGGGLLLGNNGVASQSTRVKNLCLMFAGDYVGQVNFVPEETTCGIGTTIRVMVNVQDACGEYKTKPQPATPPAEAGTKEKATTKTDAGDNKEQLLVVEDDVDDDCCCCWTVLVDCYGMGHDDDLISFVVTCPNVIASGKEGAVASECPSTVGTVDVWHIHGNQLIVHGRYVEPEEDSSQDDNNNNNDNDKDEVVAEMDDFFKFGRDDLDNADDTRFGFIAGTRKP
ncbi:hypothetical protein ACA910_005161 [Epithemia clementina (nom. ined.)]